MQPGPSLPHRPPPTVHDHFDLAKWTALFPLSALREQARQEVLEMQREDPSRYESQEAVEKHIALSHGGETVTSPRHIAVVEQLRVEAFAAHPELEKVPTDVFIWGLGEPVKREITKVGGIPYWPADRPWPVSTEGRPMDFVAQINFSDSRDLVGDTPGDSLLMFADGECYSDWTPDDEGAVIFHWVKSADTPLIAPDAVPEPRWKLIPCYGVIHRTFDHVDPLAWELIEDDYRRPECIPIIEGTKIGGTPFWIQDPAELPGRYLCTIGSVAPTYPLSATEKVLAPFVNWEKPFGFDDMPYDLSYEHLTWGDVGSVYIFLDKKGKIHWAEQCY